METSFTGADLRKMRNRLDMSQAAFGEAIGIHANTINTWEQKPNLGLSKVVRLAIAAAVHGLPPYYGALGGFDAPEPEEEE